jgi:hypothetical protein
LDLTFGEDEMSHKAKIFCLVVLLSLMSTAASGQRLHPAERDKTARTVLSDFKTGIEFRNETDKTVKIFWLDENGNRKFSGNLAPGRSKEFETYLSEPWLVTDESDNALSLYYPDAQPRIVYLRDVRRSDSERGFEDDNTARPEKDYAPINICGNQPIPRGFLIVAAGNDFNCPNWSATGKNSYTIKRPRPNAPITVCSAQSIPRGFVITAASNEWGCPNWTATSKNAYTITRPKDEQAMCDVSEVPRGFVIVSTYNEWNCPNWTATGKNARKIRRVQ